MPRTTNRRRYIAGFYHFSDYWQIWSKIVAVDGFQVTVMELTPLNWRHDLRWEDYTTFGKIRSHFTPLGRHDIVTPNLPAEVEAYIVEALGHKPDCLS